MDIKTVNNILSQFQEKEEKNLYPEDPIISCELCKGDLIYGENNFLTCINKNCGFIHRQNIDTSAEWRYYGADDHNTRDPTRCGMPINPLLQESSYSCQVICKRGSTYEMKKIKKYTEWQSMPYKEKSQYDEFEKIKMYAINSNLPKIIIDEALKIHKKISCEQSFRGLNRQGVIAASIYIACKMHNFPRTPNEIAEIFNLKNASATKGCKNAITIINFLEKENNNKTYLHQTKPISFIERYCSKLFINDELTKLGKFIALQLEIRDSMYENTPNSIAAGIIYFISNICHLKISKKEVKEVSNISEVTINKVFRKLLEMINELVPKVILEKYMC